MAGTQVHRAMLRRPSPRTVLAIASLGGAVAFIDATIVNIALPNIARSFPGTSISTLSWILNAYNIVFAAFLVAAGRIADLLGRRRVFIFGLELFTAGSLLCAIAPSAGTLVAFRVIRGVRLFSCFRARLRRPGWSTCRRWFVAGRGDLG
jgi:NTE family protein